MGTFGTKNSASPSPGNSQGQQRYSKQNPQLSQGGKNLALQRHEVKPSRFAIFLATDATFHTHHPWDVSATTTRSSWHSLLSGTELQCAYSWNKLELSQSVPETQHQSDSGRSRSFLHWLRKLAIQRAEISNTCTVPSYKMSRKDGTMCTSQA